MKVVCDSCQAKYQVPDERVAGKKLKIRCKRCGATVLIRGDLLGDLGSGTETGMPAPTGSDLSQTLSGARDHDHDDLDMSGAERASIPSMQGMGVGRGMGGMGGMGAGSADDDYEWHVSLDGDTQGPFSTAALQSWLNTTPSGWDAHVWREGFPDWIDARACAELGPAPAVPVMSSLQEDELPTQTFNSTSFDGTAFMAEMAAPRSSVHHTAASQHVRSDQPRARTEGMVDSAPQRHGVQASTQSFYSNLASSGSARASGSISSAPLAPGGHGGTPVAPVLPGAATAGGATYTPGPNPGFASGEASGLIDIRALASLARQSTTQITKNADATGANRSVSPGALHAGGGAAAFGAQAARNGSAPNGAAKAANRTDPSGLSYGQDDSRAQPTGFGRFDSIAPVTHSVSSNAALPLAILGGCALVAAAVLAAVLFNKKPSTDSATAPATTQEHQQSESAATAMPNEQGANPPNPNDGKADGKAEHKAAPEPDSHDPSSAVGPEDEPTVAPASVEESESDELSKGKRARAPQTASQLANQAASADKEPAPNIEPKPKVDDKAAAQAVGQSPPGGEAPEAMLADRAKPVKQAPPLVVTPLGAAEESKPADSAKAVSEPDPALASKPQPAPKPTPSGSRSLDDLLANASGDKPASTAASAPAPTTTSAAPSAATATQTANASAAEAEDLPEQPSRDETLAAMRGVEAAVRACAATETVTGTAEVAINVAGATGRVTSATVTGITGTVGSCIARAVRNARFPRFSRGAFSIKYPYRF